MVIEVEAQAAEAAVLQLQKNALSLMAVLPQTVVLLTAEQAAVLKEAQQLKNAKKKQQQMVEKPVAERPKKVALLLTAALSSLTMRATIHGKKKLMVKLAKAQPNKRKRPQKKPKLTVHLVKHLVRQPLRKSVLHLLLSLHPHQSQSQK